MEFIQGYYRTWVGTAAEITDVTTLNLRISDIYICSDSNIVYRWSGTAWVDWSAAYQALLISGTNIKTINGVSILGIGNIETEGDTDEKVKYDVNDPMAGYIADKFVAGTNISLAEGAGEDENKLVINVTGGGGLGYTIQMSSVAAATASMTDSTTYYFSESLSGFNTSGDLFLDYYVPKTGTITQVSGNMMVRGTKATTENVTLRISVNGTPTTIKSDLTMENVNNSFLVTGLSIAVTQGQYVQLVVVTPAWATNPTNVYPRCILYIE